MEQRGAQRIFDINTVNSLEDQKRQTGKYYTEGNPFVLKPFRDWARRINLKEKVVLEPFAGANNIIKSLHAAGYKNKFQSFDINSKNKRVKTRDTLEDFPQEHNLAITNPPWLARNSATRRGLGYPDTEYDDLYKHCLEVCLRNCGYLGALVPATFLQSSLFRDRLDTFIFLHDRMMFFDTENPVALALFSRKPSRIKIYNDDHFVGDMRNLAKHLPKGDVNFELTFNDPKGKLGFIAFDDTREPSIKFCKGDELEGYAIKHSSRMITRIGGNFRDIPNLVGKLNKKLGIFRKNTADVFLTPFKGLRADGRYRRRMEYSLARDLISSNND